MSFFLIIILLSFVFLTVIISAALWPYRGGSPIFWYPIALALMGIGIFLQIDFSHPSHETHIVAIFLATISYAIPTLFFAEVLGLRVELEKFKRKPLIEDRIEVRTVVFILFLISLVVSILYFVRTGANMLVMALTSGIQDDYSTVRLAMYAGENYMAAGYYNQFKNFLLPLTSLLVSLYIWKKSPRLGRLAAAILAILCVFAVAGAGQRTYLVFAFFASIFGLALYQSGRAKIFSKKILVAFVLLFVAFSMMSSIYKGTDDGIWEPILLSLERIFYSQQWAGLVAFEFVYDKPIVWLAEWYDSLRGILPGYRGSDLANHIHDYMFQSFRGTAPPTLIGSAYHNGGLILVSITFAFLGVIHTHVYKLFLAGPRSTARCFGYGALFFYLVTFFVGTPKYIFDNGIFAFWLFLFLIKLRWKPNSVAAVRKIA